LVTIFECHGKKVNVGRLCCGAFRSICENVSRDQMKKIVQDGGISLLAKVMNIHSKYFQNVDIASDALIKLFKQNYGVSEFIEMDGISILSNVQSIHSEKKRLQSKISHLMSTMQTELDKKEAITESKARKRVSLKKQAAEKSRRSARRSARISNQYLQSQVNIFSPRVTRSMTRLAPSNIN
jgi:hypothetical protein